MPPNILVVVVDGLRASASGAYGNTSFATPALDQLAADSFLLDWCFATSADLPDIYRALWQSRVPTHPDESTHRDMSIGPKTSAPALPSLPQFLADLGYATKLVTDEPLLSTFSGAAQFGEIIDLSNIDSASIAKCAGGISNTSLYQAFAAAMSQIGAAQLNKPNLIWFHSRGMYGPWDAPLALQETLLDEGDPPPIGSATPPDLELSSDHDPDVIFRYACAYAAQVMVLDSCCERLQDGLQTAEDEPWLAMLIGCRGYPLGEHFRIGRVDPRLYAEQLHVPWLIRIPDGLGCLARSQALTSHHDLLPMLIDWIDRDATTVRAAFDGLSILPLATAARTPWREALISTSPTARAIRTAEWCLREDLALSSKANRSEEGEKFPQPELYVRPDDRWEANDVAKLCPDVVHELRARLIKTAHSARC